MAADRDSWMVIGRVAGPFGVHGEVKVELLTDFPERFDVLKEAHFGPERRILTVERRRRHRGMVLLQLSGVDSPEQVDALRGFEVAVPRSAAVELPAGHYFLEDIVGVNVETENGHAVGTVRDVIRTGSNDVFVVRAGSREILIPAIKDAILDLDLADRRVTVADWVLLAPE